MKLFKKVLAMALSLAMVAGMSVGAWADVAATTLQAQIDAAASGGIITLTGNIAETGITVAADDNVVIDLGGYTVTGDFMVYGKATIKNGTINGSRTDYSAIECNGASADLILENLNVTSWRHGVRIDGGKTTINSGTYATNCDNATTAYALNAGNSSGSPATTVIINGGSFVGANPEGRSEATAAVHVQNGVTLTINDGDFSNGVGGLITVSRSAATSNVVINDGNFESGETNAIWNQSESTKPSISGGSYDEDVTEYLSDDVVPMVSSVGSDGKIGAMSVMTAAEAEKSAAAKVVDASGNVTYFTNASAANQFAESVSAANPDAPAIKVEELNKPVVTVPTEPVWDVEVEEEEEEIELLKGSKQKYTQGADEGLSFKFDAKVKNFRRLKIDGKTVDKANYAVTEGSTIITLNPEYMDTLKAGKHTLKAIFKDGSAEVKFTVLEGAKVEASAPAADADKLNPSTGANDFVGVAVAMAVLSMAAAVALKKR